MTFIHTKMRQLLRDTYLKLLGSFKGPSPGVHIINSHFISNNKVNLVENKIVFRNFIEFISTKCTLLKIEDAVNMIIKGEKINKPYVAFTFDDGFEECYSIIAPILEDFNCNAAFFINSNYIDSDNEYKVLFEKRINVYNKTPMSWKNIKELHSRGHIIGSHTKDHMNLSNISKKHLIAQLRDDKNKLESELNYKCEYFAWPYGQKQHFSELALKFALENFKYIFSGTNYMNYFSFSGKVINRRHIEPFWDKRHINYFLSVNKKR